MRFACVKQLEIIGEASNHVSDELKQNFSEIEWSQITGMRNVFVHEIAIMSNTNYDGNFNKGYSM